MQPSRPLRMGSGFAQWLIIIMRSQCSSPHGGREKQLDFSHCADALRCECKNPECRTVLILPLDSAMNGALQHCPKCKRGWALLAESDFETFIKDFIERLHRLKQVDRLGCAMTLEIKETVIPHVPESKL